MVPHKLLVEVFDVHDLFGDGFHALLVVEVLLPLHLFESTLLVTQFEDNQLVLLPLLLNL
jgi:hypothetical protein